MAASGSRASVLALALGALLGIASAAYALLAPAGGPVEALPEDAVALVDGVPISRAEYERALAAVRADRRSERLAEGDRERILERLIEEQLLVNRAMALGLPARDGRIRAELAGAMRDTVVSRGDDEEPPSEAAARRFHRENALLFSSPPRYLLEHRFFHEEAAARAALEGASDGAPEGAPLPEGDPPPLPLPAGRVGLGALRQLLGPTIARSVSGLEVGEIGGPYRAQGGHHLIRLRAQEEGDLRPFEEVEEVVRAEMERRARERRLREFYEEERENSIIIRADSP